MSVRLERTVGLLAMHGTVGAEEAANSMAKAADIRIVRQETNSVTPVIVQGVGRFDAMLTRSEAGQWAVEYVDEVVNAPEQIRAGEVVYEMLDPDKPAEGPIRATMARE